MLTINLRTLMLLSNNTDGKLLQRKRIQCGKISYILSYVLKDGLLTIQRAKRTKTGWNRKRSARKQRERRREQSRIESLQEESDRGSETFEILETNVGSSVICDIKEPTTDKYCQTQLPEQNNAAVDTVDLCQYVTRDQQTEKRLYTSQGMQTKQRKLVGRSTQVEQSFKSRYMQTEPDPEPEPEPKPQPISTSAVGTQTKSLTLIQSSYTQTTLCDDEEELFRPHERMFHTIIWSLHNLQNLVEHFTDSVHQLVEFKHLELVKESLEAAAKLEAAKQPKVKQLNAIDRHHSCRHMLCHKFGAKATPSQGLKLKQTKNEMETQTELATTG